MFKDFPAIEAVVRRGKEANLFFSKVSHTFRLK